jgi:SAM-dependent methyltransferase
VHGGRSRSYFLSDPGERSAEAERLDRQARLLFPFERDALAAHGLAPRRTVVDLGCGQGTYLELVAAAFAGTRCVGLDRNRFLLEAARMRPGVAEVGEVDLTLPDALLRDLDRLLPDVLLCRFVLQHLSPTEQACLLSTLAAFSSRRPLRVVLVDVDAASSFVDPPSPLLTEAASGLRRLQERHGGDRRVGGRLADLLRQAGFRDVKSSRVRADSRATGFDGWWSAFGSLLCAGLDSRPSAQEALREWASDPRTPGAFAMGFDVCFASSGSGGDPGG